MCDTFVALPTHTSDGSVIFGKNSDREPNEAQVLEYHLPSRYESKATLKTTYLEIPQARETLAVLISRPFWMWGAEMGANEKGVVIGNEAVWTKMPMKKKAALTGMDLLRLALERGETAQSAIETIVRHLADYGQGGRCGYQDKTLVYHNSFIIADPKEAWVLETAAHLWAAQKVKDFASISNGLTIGEDFDLHHQELIPFAREKGWLKKQGTFHFANCYGDWFHTTFSASRRRCGRSMTLLRDGRGKIDVASALRILCDHEEEQTSYRPDKHFLGNRICAHAANPLARKSMQTTGSLVAHLKPGNHSFWVTGTSAPCTGIFKPVWFDGDVLPDLGPVPDGTYNPETLWWRHEALHRQVLKDYRSRINAYSNDRDEMEDSLIREAESLSGKDHFPLTQKAFDRVKEAEKRWLEMVTSTPIKQKPNLIYRHFWKNQNKAAGMPG